MASTDALKKSRLRGLKDVYRSLKHLGGGGRIGRSGQNNTSESIVLFQNAFRNKQTKLPKNKQKKQKKQQQTTTTKNPKQTNKNTTTNQQPQQQQNCKWQLVATDKT